MTYNNVKMNNMHINKLYLPRPCVPSKKFWRIDYEKTLITLREGSWKTLFSTTFNTLCNKLKKFVCSALFFKKENIREFQFSCKFNTPRYPYQHIDTYWQKNEQICTRTHHSAMVKRKLCRSLGRLARSSLGTQNHGEHTRK